MVILMIYIKPSIYALGQPLRKRSPALDRAYLKIPRRRRGKRNHHGGDVCGLVVLEVKFFVPAGTLIGVKLLIYLSPLESRSVSSVKLDRKCFLGLILVAVVLHQ
jgi:hypothetical protein